MLSSDHIMLSSAKEKLAWVRDETARMATAITTSDTQGLAIMAEDLETLTRMAMSAWGDIDAVMGDVRPLRGKKRG